MVVAGLVVGMVVGLIVHSQLVSQAGGLDSVTYLVRRVGLDRRRLLS